MAFIDRIHFEKNAFLVSLEVAKLNGKPFVLYGAQNLAFRIFSFLQSQSIPIHYIAADEQYIRCNETFCGRKIIPLDSLPLTGKYNFIVAFNAADRKSVYRRLEARAESILHYDVGYGAPDDPAEIIYYPCGYIEDRAEQLESVAFLLEDEISRSTLAAFINQRISGSIGAYEHYFKPDHYFPDDIVSLSHDEVYLDCGAFTGDTIQPFLDKLQRDGQSSHTGIIALEPNPDCFSLLQERYRSDKFKAIPKGVWDAPGKHHFTRNSWCSKIEQGGEDIIAVDSIDNILCGERASFIKMDVEGSELRALHGAADTLRRFKPTLAISIYHTPEDIFTIPLYIHSIVPDYRLFMRAHASPMTIELVCYAVL